MNSLDELKASVACLDVQDCQSLIDALDKQISALNEKRGVLVRRILDLYFPFRVGQLIRFGNNRGRILSVTQLWGDGCRLRIRLVKKDGTDSKVLRDLRIYTVQELSRRGIEILKD